jgi:hypothetical protein
VLELEKERRTFDFTVLLAADEEQLIGTIPATDGGLSVSYRDGLELTRFPSELLFRGSWSEVAAKVRRGAFNGSTDRVEWLERAFLIRAQSEELDHPRSPADVLAAETPLKGRWWAVVADGPWDAFVHVRDHPKARLDDESTCSECYVAVDGVFDSSDAVVQYCTLKQQQQQQQQQRLPKL